MRNHIKFTIFIMSVMLAFSGLRAAEAVNTLKYHAYEEESGKVLAVFQGHSHKNDHNDIAGIHYCTLVAMVEGSGAKNNGFSIMKIAQDGSILIEGFRKQADYQWRG